MKTEISSLELYYLTKEFKVLEGSKIDRIYHSKNNYKELTIVCHVSNKGRIMLRTLLPGIIFLDDSKEASDSPTGFGMMLRKYLEGGRIRMITQKDFERVLTITIETRDEETVEIYNLIIELFSKGNMIFCDEKFTILNILDEQEWKDRSLKKKEIYKYPKSKINTLETSDKDFSQAIKTSGKDSIVKALAITFNLGGPYAEELCHLSNLHKDEKVDSISEEIYDKLHKNLVLMLHREPAPNRTGNAIYPFIMESIQSQEQPQAYDDLSAAIRNNYDLLKHEDTKGGHTKNIDKIQNTINEQLKLLEEAQNEYESNQRKGEILYEQYQHVNNILEVVREARKSHSWAQIRQKIKEDPKLSRIITDIDEKNNSIIINIE